MRGMKQPDTAHLEARLDCALNLMDTLGPLNLSIFQAGIKPESKAKDYYDPVTKADRDTEKSLRKGIRSLFPDDHIIGEEYGVSAGRNGWEWYLDPIDGTRAFVSGVPVWSTLIGICYQSQPLIGVIDHPALEKRYVGVHGVSWRVTKDGRQKLCTRPCPDMDTAILACTEPMAIFTPDQLSVYKVIREKVRFTRLGLDALGYALTAAGRMDLVLEAGLKVHDLAALIPVVTGAGGIITDWNGGSALKDGAVICAGDPVLAEQIYPYLKGVNS